MKIMFISTTFLPHRGGIEIVINRLSRSLAENGFKCSILCSKGKSQEHIEAHNALSWNPFFTYPKFGRLTRKMDVVHQFDPLMKLTLNSLLGKKRVLTLAGSKTEYVSEPVRIFSQQIFHRITSVSDWIGRKFPSKTLYPAYPISSKLKCEGEEYILTVCRLDPRKNIETILKAAELVNFPFKIVGGGNKRYLRELLKLKPDNVEFIGEVPNEKLWEAYAHAKIFCLPSFHEAFGLVFYEAMCFGLPIVSASRAAIPEVVGNAGILIEDPLDYQELATKIQRLLDDERRLNYLKRKARKRAEKFSWEKTVNEYIKIYEELAS